MPSFTSVLRATGLFALTVLVIAPTYLRAQTGPGGTPGGTGPGGTPGGTGPGGTPGGTGPGSGVLVNPLGSIDSLPKLLDAILGAVVQLGAIFLVLMLVFVGFKFVMAQGNEEELRSARAALMWTIIGGLLLLGAQAISLVIQDTVKGLQ